MEEVFRSGQQYLMSKEKALGSEGLFLDRSIRDYHNGLYDDYHTSYCAAAGLLEPAYTEVNRLTEFISHDNNANAKIDYYYFLGSC